MLMNVWGLVISSWSAEHLCTASSPWGGRGVTAPGASARSAESSVTRSRSSDGKQRRRRVHAAWAAPQGRDPLVRAGAAAAGGRHAAERPSRLDGC